MKQIKGSPLSGDRTPDRLISQLTRYDEYNVPNDLRRAGGCYDNTILLGERFLCTANPHSTGCGVTISVLSEDRKSTLTIQVVTYWYSDVYTFNSSLIERGPWDMALEKAIADGWAWLDRQREIEEQQMLNDAADKERARLEARKEFETGW